jgi:hypothetical protein
VGSEPVISFFNRANLFLRVCPFHFYDICKMIRVDSGCVIGKIYALQNQILINPRNTIVLMA